MIILNQSSTQELLHHVHWGFLRFVGNDDTCKTGPSKDDDINTQREPRRACFETQKQADDGMQDEWERGGIGGRSVRDGNERGGTHGVARVGQHHPPDRHHHQARRRHRQSDRGRRDHDPVCALGPLLGHACEALSPHVRARPVTLQANARVSE